MTTTAKPNFFNELTGVRAIAAYLVFFHHMNIFSQKHFGYFINYFVDEFHIGVTFFFVLSGFLICYRYYDNIKLRDNKWIVQYIQNRVARIYPMYFLITTITFIVFFLTQSDAFKNVILYICNITFIRGFFDSLKFTGVPQGWTLTVEECFYFSAPVIFIISKRMKLIVPFLFVYGIGIALVLIFRNVSFYGFFNNFVFMFSYTYFGRAFEFFIGIMLALLYKRKYQHQDWQKKLRTPLGIISVIACLSALALIRKTQSPEAYTDWGIVINNFILPVGIATLYLGLITETTFIKKILATPLFVLLGKSSYTFYLVHIGVISALVLKHTQNVLVLFVIMNLISIALFKFVEDPSNRFIRNLRIHSSLSDFKRRRLSSYKKGS